MKDNIILVTVIVGILVVMGGIVYGLRFFSNIATPITLHEVKPGVVCATMVTDDGAAIDCWKEGFKK